MNKILIADDEQFERELLDEIVHRHFDPQIQTRLAESGRQAIDVAGFWKPSMVLMDIEMPGINGINAAKRIIERDPSVKVIFVTAYSLFNYAYEAVKLGAFDYILKPVNETDTVKSIRRCLGQVESREQLEALASVAESLEEHSSADKISLLMSNVRNYLQHNYMRMDISLDSISDILHINPSYFSMLFKKNFGVNFVDYVTELRISASKELLKDPFLSATEIANAVGYESLNYYTRVFKKTTGVTPTEYRRNHSAPAGREEET